MLIGQDQLLRANSYIVSQRREIYRLLTALHFLWQRCPVKLGANIYFYHFTTNTYTFESYIQNSWPRAMKLIKICESHQKNAKRLVLFSSIKLLLKIIFLAY